MYVPMLISREYDEDSDGVKSSQVKRGRETDKKDAGNIIYIIKEGYNIGSFRGRDHLEL